MKTIMNQGSALLGTTLVVFLLTTGVHGWGDDKVLLKDVQVLTLHNGRMTTGRRSAPVPQLHCVGGSAAGQFHPQVVQCYNRGFDGNDIQWECKADMDNTYRFGKVDVVCEGYDYPSDPYILKGSCGVEYELEYTKEGYSQQHQHHQQRSDSSYYSSYKSTQKSTTMSDVITLCVVGVIIYVVYLSCIASQDPETDGRRSSDGQPTGPPPPYPGRQPPTAPPPYDDQHKSYSSHSQSFSPNFNRSRSGLGGGGFWTGAATGGVLGYLFGGRNNYGYTRSPGYGYSSGWGSPRTTYSSPGYGGFGGFGGRSSSSSSSGSSGTRTASGFGGTKRR